MRLLYHAHAKVSRRLHKFRTETKKIPFLLRSFFFLFLPLLRHFPPFRSFSALGKQKKSPDQKGSVEPPPVPFACLIRAPPFSGTQGATKPSPTAEAERASSRDALSAWSDSITEIRGAAVRGAFSSRPSGDQSLHLI
jgi:hypothetical protein